MSPSDQEKRNMQVHLIGNNIDSKNSHSHRLFKNYSVKPNEPTNVDFF